MIGERIKALRIEKGITQQQFADLMSVAKSTVGMWETNKREPDIETLKQIAKVFETPFYFLLNDTIKIGREFESDDSVEHCCPICGCENIHIADTLLVDFHESPKSSGYALRFWCEADHIFYIVIEDYKGINWMTYTDEHFHAIKSVLREKKSSLDIKMDALDSFGKKAVRDLIDTEYARCIQSKQQLRVIQIRKHLNKAAAGFGYDLSSEDEWEVIEVVDTYTARAADFAVEVDGDSMLPDFRDGDIVLVKLEPDVPVGKVGLFIHDGMGYIKERGKKKLVSRNPEYPDIEGEARCIGLVIGLADLPED